MRAIYKPKGKALEYAKLAVNLYSGCSNGCIYCYAPRVLRQDSSYFKNFSKPRKDILRALEKDALKIKGSVDNVLLCFTCDPYQYIEAKYKVTREAIAILNNNYIPVTILTKSGILATRDFDLLQCDPNNSFGVTLTFDTDEESKIWEPEADTPSERIDSLATARSKAISTWVSLEPVINPDAVFRLIDMSHYFVNVYKIGKWNYDDRAKNIDWPRFRKEVSEKLDKLGKRYLFKSDLLKSV